MFALLNSLCLLLLMLATILTVEAEEFAGPFGGCTFTEETENRIESWFHGDLPAESVAVRANRAAPFINPPPLYPNPILTILSTHPFPDILPF
jgi:hypothetical protein